MVQKFADFELDAARRELRLRGRVVVLQPLVLDLLLLLVDHRDRVVTKDELLETLWPDVVVADGAVHRAVSLARSALQTGGMEHAIRTQARVGYRFSADVAEADSPDASNVIVALATARVAFDKSDWNAARAAFAEADTEKALEAADLERWATACQFAGQMQEAIAPFARAVAAHASAGDRRGAARAAIWLANIELEASKESVARGWRNRAATYLANEHPCVEHGLLAWITARLSIFAGDMDAALEQATLALEIGRKFDDADLEALGLNYQALVHLALGDVACGVPLQDEAAAAVASGQVGPWAGGIVFCGLIWSCVNRGDWRRANQWTDNFDRWVERQGVEPYPGLCRLHRAEILTMRGEFAKAERQLLALREVLAATAPYAEGDLFRVLGDARMARGDLDGADEAFRRAYELGWDPQPGRAMLQVQQGKAEQALRALELSLESRAWPSRQRRMMLLAHLVVVAVAAGQPERARSVLAELDAGPRQLDLPALDAMVTRARAELALIEGRRTEAIAALHRAAALWRDAGSPFAEGSIRIRLAELLRADGDLETADLELAAADRAFREVGLSPASLPSVEEENQRGS